MTQRKSAAPVKFRAVADLADGNGYRPLSGLVDYINTAVMAAEMAITAGDIDADAFVAVQSSFTGDDGTVEWHDQRVVQRPRGPKWKEYCETHKLCSQCGHIVEREKHASSCGAQPGGDSGRHDQQHAG